MKNKRFIKILVGIIIFVYVFISSNAANEIKKIGASLSSNDSVKEVVSLDDDLYVYFIDVGQADSILISNKNENMLIDAGNNEDGNLLVSYLKSLNVSEIKYLVGTHPHEDHIGGMDDIINNFKIDKYYMPNEVATTKTFEDVLDALENNNLKYTTPKVNDTFFLGDSLIRVVSVLENTSDLNDSSIVLRLTYGNNSFLFTGDATKKIENEILSNGINVKSDVLKVAHHGSDYSSSDSFLKAVNPKFAVISVGKNNTYNHPNAITLSKLEALNTKVYRTDIDGTIIMKSDGNNISVQTIKTNTNG